MSRMIEIRKSTMSGTMKQDALKIALLAVNNHEEEKDIARYIKTQFDRKYGGTWQCILGNFVTCLSYKLNSYISFSVGDERMVLFKTA